MSKPKKLTIEEVRKMSTNALATHYGIPKKQMYTAKQLKAASNPDYFSTITNHELSLEEMADETGLTKDVVSSYRHALIKTGFETPKKRSVVPDKIKSFLKGKPSTYEEIRKEMKRDVYYYIRILRRRGEVRTVTIELSRAGVKRTFRSQELVDGLTDRVIAYLPGEEKLVGEKVTEYLPKKLTTGMRKSLSHRLKPILPKEAFETVHEYMQEHAVRT